MCSRKMVLHVTVYDSVAVFLLFVDTQMTLVFCPSWGMGNQAEVVVTQGRVFQSIRRLFLKSWFLYLMPFPSGMEPPGLPVTFYTNLPFFWGKALHHSTARGSLCGWCLSMRMHCNVKRRLMVCCVPRMVLVVMGVALLRWTGLLQPFT